MCFCKTFETPLVRGGEKKKKGGAAGRGATPARVV
jgi:hypothetical protein